MARRKKSLRFLWWNVESFAHYERSRAGESSWPREPGQYQAKCTCIDQALRSIYRKSPPELLAFAEITKQAASELRDWLLPSYEVFSLDLISHDPKLQVAFIYDPTAGFENEGVYPIRNVPRGTRPIGYLDYCYPGNRIRVFACHWTARFQEESDVTRQCTAEQLRIQIYDYLNETSGLDEQRHVIVMGDLNEEPYGLVEKTLFASRSRARARSREHYTDRDVRRVRLYNCSWRFLGERLPHSGVLTAGDTAGTHYWKAKKRWCTFDQIIASGSLVSDTVPFLDEAHLEVVVTPEILGGESIPSRFIWDGKRSKGLSDHLPVRGRIRLA